MAIRPQIVYPGQTATGDPGYPHGKAQNVTVLGDGTGTPLEKDWLNDVFGLQQALLHLGGATPSGTPDKVGASQYLDALLSGASQVNGARNWYTPIVADNLSAQLDTIHVRTDGSIGIFYAPSRAYWIICGSDAAGFFYFGEVNAIGKQDTGVASPPKFSFGCDATNAGRMLLFSSDAVGAAGTISYARSATGVAVSSWTKLSLPGAVTTDAQACDAVVTQTGRVVVVGGRDGRYRAWLSDDGGDSATWTQVDVGARVNSIDNLDRVIVGKSNLLVAFTDASSVNGGNKLWYSSDNGATWTARSGLAFSDMNAACYSAVEDLWYFAHGGVVEVTSDPIAGSFTTRTITGTGAVKTLACSGAALVAAVDESTAWYLVSSIDAGVTWKLVHRTPVKYVGMGVSPQGQFAALGFSVLNQGVVQLSQRV